MFTAPVTGGLSENHENVFKDFQSNPWGKQDILFPIGKRPFVFLHPHRIGVEGLLWIGACCFQLSPSINCPFKKIGISILTSLSMVKFTIFDLFMCVCVFNMGSPEINPLRDPEDCRTEVSIRRPLNGANFGSRSDKKLTGACCW